MGLKGLFTHAISLTIAIAIVSTIVILFPCGELGLH